MMRYRILGPSGVRVSEVALGTMTFGDDWGWGAPPADAHAIFDAYVELGGNFIDTACNYTDGSSERLVGECVGTDRDRFVIASKYSLTTDPTDPNAGGNHRKSLVRSLDGTLRRLGTEYVDVLYLHMWDGLTSIEEVMRALDVVVHSGKVHNIAFSDTPAWVVARGVEIARRYGWAQPIAIQAPYSAISRDPERELQPMAEGLGLAFVAWGVLEDGQLTGKHLEGPTDGARVSSSTLASERLELIRRFCKLADEAGLSPVELAVRWVLDNRASTPTIPILGARTADQLKGQLNALNRALTPDLYRAVGQLTGFELGFPRSFLESDHVKSLIHGETRERLALVP